MARVKLIPFTREYLDRSWDWLRDPEIKVLTMAPDFTREDQIQFFESLPDRDDYKIWGVESADGRPIGAAGLKHISGSAAETWCYIGERAYWGRGVGGCIIEACEEEARRLGIKLLTIIVHESNERSLRTYGKMGFGLESQDDEAHILTLVKSL